MLTLLAAGRAADELETLLAPLQRGGADHAGRVADPGGAMRGRIAAPARVAVRAAVGRLVGDRMEVFAGMPGLMVATPRVPEARIGSPRPAVRAARCLGAPDCFDVRIVSPRLYVA